MNKGCQRKLKKTNSIILRGFQDVDFFSPTLNEWGKKKKKIKTLKFWRLLNSNSFWFEALCFNSWQISLQCHELFTLSIVTCIRNKESLQIQTKIQTQLESLDVANPLQNFTILFPKRSIYRSQLSPEGAFNFKTVKNSQSAQMPTKETPSYFNQIKWILIYNAIS